MWHAGVTTQKEPATDFETRTNEIKEKLRHKFAPESILLLAFRN